MAFRADLAFLLLPLITGDAIAETPPEDPVSLNNLGSHLYAAGQYRLAEAPLARAVQLSSEQQPLEREIAMQNLAAVYRSEGRFGEAIPLYQEAIRLRERQAGPAQLDLLAPLEGLALLYTDSGDFKQSRSIVNRAISIGRLHRDEQSADAANGFLALGAMLAAQGKYSQAKSWIGAALNIRNRLFGAGSAESADALMDLAAIYLRERRFEEGERTYSQALQNYGRTAEDGKAATAMAGLGALLSVRHKYPEAGDLLEQALALLERNGSRSTFEAGQIKMELARVRAAEKQTGEAAALYREALGILEPALGPENPRLLPPLASYSKTLHAQKDYVAAAQVDLQIMKICVKQTLREGKQSAFGGAMQACTAPIGTVRPAESGSGVSNVASPARSRGSITN